MKTYYPLSYKLNSKYYYLIWYTNDKDGIFLDEKRKILIFPSLNKLEHFCKSFKVTLEQNKDVAVHDFDNFRAWLSEKSMVASKEDCKNIIDIWNFFTDLANSLQNKSLLKKEEDFRRSMTYEKLFAGLNLPTINRTNKTYLPKFDEEEIIELGKLLEITIDTIINNSIIKN